MSVKINDNSDKILDEFQEKILRGLERVGSQAEGYAKDLCPVGTPQSTGKPGYIGGTLKNSITHAISGQAPAITSYADDSGKIKGSYSGSAPNSKVPSVYIGTNVEYGPYVELGTAKMAAQPYLKPAVAGHVKTYENIVEDELKNG